MAATAQHTTSRKRAPTIQQQAEAPKNPAITADRATLEDPTLPECVLRCARKRLERLEKTNDRNSSARNATTEGQ